GPRLGAVGAEPGQRLGDQVGAEIGHPAQQHEAELSPRQTSHAGHPVIPVGHPGAPLVTVAGMPDPVLPTTARALLARTARAQRDGRAPSLVAGVVRDGGLVWSVGRGTVAEPHTDVQYRLGSISKTVTAIAVMRLRDEGLLHLDDPLERHL